MDYSDFDLLSVHVERGIAFVDIDNPPINLMTIELVEELLVLASVVTEDDAVKVVVFQSANPDFFIAHADLNLIAAMPILSEDEISALETGPIQQLISTYRRLPKATIGKLSGRARGGGSEFLLALDMRFAANETAVLGQPEAAVGIIPGAGGTQSLARLVGRSRALEITLGCQDFSAAMAERYGYVNRALPAAELDQFVDALAYRIATFPMHVLQNIKEAVDTAEKTSFDEGLLQEWRLFNASLAEKETRSILDDMAGVAFQTKDFELELPRNLFLAIDKRINSSHKQ